MKILAIDIGSAQIKSAVFDAKFNRFDIIRHDIVEVADALAAAPPESHLLSEGQIAALRAIWAQSKDVVDRVVTNIPYNLYTCRLLTFPFSDRKKINAAAPFQIEDEVPFDLEKCIVANQIFANEGGAETFALTGVAQVSDLQNFIGGLVNSTEIDPDVLTTTQSSTYSFLDRGSRIFAGKAVAIINLGHRSSSINIYKDCVPILNRTSMVGGFNITQAIAKTYGIGVSEAEVAKIQSGFLAPPGIEQTNEQRMFSDLIALVLEPVFHDFYQALMAYFSRHRERVTQIYVTGGTSLLPGTADYLAARWQVPVHPLKVTSQLPNISIHPTANTDLMLSQAIFLGLSQVEGRSKDTQNFRTGALRREGAGFNFNLKALEQPLKVFAAVYLFAILAMSVQYFLLTDQVAKKDIKRDAAIRRVFTGIKAMPLLQLKQNPEKLRRDAKAKVDELRGRLAGAADEPTFSALNVLKEMSQTLPAPPAVKVRQLNMTPASVKVKLESNSQADIDRALNALKTLKMAAPSTAEPLRETLPDQKKTASVEIKLKAGSMRK